MLLLFIVVSLNEKPMHYAPRVVAAAVHYCRLSRCADVNHRFPAKRQLAESLTSPEAVDFEMLSLVQRQALHRAAS